MDIHHRVILGDSRKMDEVGDESVHLVVTSPPYWQLKDYGKARQIDYEFILIFKKRGKAPKVDQDVKERSRLSREEWNQYFSGHWQFAGVKQKNHLAMFPEELPKRLIKTFSFAGEVVLDPFLGSGTTTLAAKNLDRDSIRYEINEDFLSLIRERLDLGSREGKDQEFLPFEQVIEILKSDRKGTDFSEQWARLPYLFDDPTMLSRKADAKELRFDSRVDGEDYNRERYFTVRQIVSPDRVLLDNGLEVRLIGIIENPEKRAAAIDYLTDTTKGQRVYVRAEDEEHLDARRGASGALRGYLYLKNRTPLNTHLIKRGLVFVDRESDYREKERFIKLAASFAS